MNTIINDSNKDDPYFHLFLSVVNACCTEDPKTRVPEIGTIHNVCTEIAALIPEDKHVDLVAPKAEEYSTMFSRDIAKVIAWLDLLKNELPHKSKCDVQMRRKEGLTGVRSLCVMALFRQVEADRNHQLC